MYTEGVKQKRAAAAAADSGAEPLQPPHRSDEKGLKV